MYDNRCFFLRGDACTRAELSALKFDEEEIENSNMLKVNQLTRYSDCRQIIVRALALGFEFRSKEDRLNFNQDNLSVMHRRPTPREFA